MPATASFAAWCDQNIAESRSGEGRRCCGGASLAPFATARRKYILTRRKGGGRGDHTEESWRLARCADWPAGETQTVAARRRFVTEFESSPVPRSTLDLRDLPVLRVKQFAAAVRA